MLLLTISRLGRSLQRLLGAILLASLLVSLLDVGDGLHAVRLIVLALMAGLGVVAFGLTAPGRAYLVRMTDLLGNALQRLPVCPVAIGALILRLGWVLVARVEPVSDFAAFDSMASKIVEDGIVFFPDKPIGASVLIAGIYQLVGANPLAAQIAYAVLGTASVVVLYVTTQSMFPEATSAAPAAGLLLALWPSQIVYTSLLGPEIPFSLVLLLVALAMALWLRYHNGWLLAAAGVGLGLGQYLRPESALFIPGVFILIITQEAQGLTNWGLRSVGHLLRHVCTPLVFYLIAISPFVLYWYVAHGLMTISPAPYQTGMALLMGTSRTGWDDATSDQVTSIVKVTIPYSCSQDPVCRARELDKASRDLAVSIIRAHPLEKIGNAFLFNVPRLWGREPSWRSWVGAESRISLGLSSLLYGVGDTIRLPFAFAAALVLIGARGRPAIPTLVTWYYGLSALLVTLFHMALESQPKYGFAFVPLLSVLAAVFICQQIRADGLTAIAGC